MGDLRPKEKIVSIRDYTLKELSDFYGVSPYIMRKRIKKHDKVIGQKDGHYYLFEQVKKIFELIKLPSNITLVV